MLNNYEMKFHPNNHYITTKEKIINILDKRDDIIDNESFNKVNNVQISDVVISKVEFKDIESALVTLKHFLE